MIQELIAKMLLDHLASVRLKRTILEALNRVLWIILCILAGFIPLSDSAVGVLVYAVVFVSVAYALFSSSVNGGSVSIATEDAIEEMIANQNEDTADQYINLKSKAFDRRLKKANAPIFFSKSPTAIWFFSCLFIVCVRSIGLVFYSNI